MRTWNEDCFPVLLLLIVNAALSFQSKCSICEGIVDKFKEGLKKTAKSNFGGGNTRWEEKSLGKYAFSETRLLEILDNVCSSSSECHNLLEQHEENIENWWFKVYAKKQKTDLHEYLCIDRVRNGCCAEGSWGPNCEPCPGGKDNPCRGAGSCNGAGDKEGTGQCSCNSGYEGDECENCAENHFEESRNNTHTVCKACHDACKGGCSEEGPAGCNDCKDGWSDTDDGCFDINECEENPCRDDQYCSNTDGSYSCVNCDKACQGCLGAGTSNCVMCAEMYFKEGDTCKACHRSCQLSCSTASPKGCHSCTKGWTWTDDRGCVDIDECADGSVTCEEGQYCKNIQGSHRCTSCDSACEGCTGPGDRKCLQCKEGYEDKDGACRDKDECESTTACPENEECKNLPGSFSCDCKKGFTRKDGACVDKSKPKPEKVTMEDSPQAVRYKGPGNCDTCKDIVKKIFEGIASTDKQNFGGGNTKWEEQKLGSYIYSETRFTEVLESACAGLTSNKEKQCAHMLEKYEATLEEWWFNIFAKEKDPELENWFCIHQVRICCPSGTFGAECKPCPGGTDTPCSGNGKCKGDGTREGRGVCKCDQAYKGKTCNECAAKAYTESQNDTHIVCKECDESCGDKGCFNTGPAGCHDCKTGYSHNAESGCQDIDECAENPCQEDEYCDNQPGSHSCSKCNDACVGCTNKGNDNCVECADNYYMDEEDANKCKICDRACKKGCSGPGREKCNAECRFGYNFVENEGCVDVNECEDGTHTCPDGKYCENTVGHFQCKKCDYACVGSCTGAGPENCMDCKDGYIKNENGGCVDIDECLIQTHNCHGEGRICVNTPGSFMCSCEDGYVQKLDKCIKRKGRPTKDQIKPPSAENTEEGVLDIDEQTDKTDKEEL